MKIPLNSNTLGDEEINAAVAVLKSGFFTMGAKCLQFEEQFAEFMGVKNAIFVNSGSSANLIAAFALANVDVPLGQGKKRLKPGDEVIVPAVTWSTTIWPIVQAGGVPVLVDSDPKTLQMDLQQVEDAIGPKTVAIFPVHVLGNAVPLTPLQSLAKKHGLWLVEDTCESLGTRSQGKWVGTQGDVGTFSFFFSHHITTIEGGMLVTDNDNLAELFRCLRAHGWTRHLKKRAEVEARHPEIDPRFLFVNTGFNLRPTEINAALGMIQLKKLNDFNFHRRKVVSQWNQEFAPLMARGFFESMKPTESAEATWFGYPILCKTPELRKKLQNHLEAQGIETRPIICGNIARQPAFRNIPHRVQGSLKGADQIMDCGLFWGAHPNMTQAEVDYVTAIVKDFFSKDLQW